MSLLRRSRAGAALALVLVTVAFASGATAQPAAALNPIKPVCGVAGVVSGLLGKACTVVQNGGRWAKAGKKLLGGHVGAAAKTVLGEGGGRVASAATATVGFAAIATGVLGGAKLVLSETATVLGRTTSPQLGSTWFSSMYWRIAGISAVLTMPFLFAAAIQALIRSDLALLLRATLGYLPLAMLAVSVAAPVTMLLLAASDQLSAVVSSAGGDAGAHFLRQASVTIGKLTLLSGSPFLAIMVGLFLVAGAFALWIELLMREAAVYVIVLMLPLAFAALVWPARRIWAIRAVELLAALILSKFAIVAVLSLGGAALSAGTGHGLTAAMVGVVLLIMGAFAPWALLRLLPLAELASSAVGSLRSEMRGAVAPSLTLAAGTAGAGEDWATSTTARMRRDAFDTSREEAAQDATQGARDADPGPDAPDADPGQDARDADPGQDARDATSGPPARHEGLDENGDRVRPQGGRQSASQAVPENLEAPASEPEDPGVATARTDTPASEPDDPEPILQEMWRDEHRGKHKPSLGDDPPPPPDIEQS